jgi:surface protein
MGGSIFGGLLVFYLTGRRVFQLAKLNIPSKGRNELS